LVELLGTDSPSESLLINQTTKLRRDYDGEQRSQYMGAKNMVYEELKTCDSLLSIHQFYQNYSKSQFSPYHTSTGESVEITQKNQYAIAKNKRVEFYQTYPKGEFDRPRQS
jgi:hypothetical protein